MMVCVCVCGVCVGVGECWCVCCALKCGGWCGGCGDMYVHSSVVNWCG